MTRDRHRRQGWHAASGGVSCLQGRPAGPRGAGETSVNQACVRDKAQSAGSQGTQVCIVGVSLTGTGDRPERIWFSRVLCLS